MSKNTTQRSALGDIGNKPQDNTNHDDKQLKPVVQLPRIDNLPLPSIHIETHDEEDVDMETEEEEEVVQLPEGVVDIDALEDQNNPQLCVEYAPAIYAYLRDVEEGLSIRKDFLSG